MTTVAELARVLESRGLLEGVTGDRDTTIRGVAQDSRTVESGDLFLAWEGTAADGHDFLAQAWTRGAVACVVERPSVSSPVPELLVRDGREAAAFAADHIHGSPWRRAFVVGVTGTNGKTTTALLSRWVLSETGDAAACIGTLGVVGQGGEVWEGTEGLTTPGPVQLAEWGRTLDRSGAVAVVIEASSHALDQRRVEAVAFDSAVFTNIGRDHLDYHTDLDDYVRAKRRLAELLVPGGVAVVLADEPAWKELGAPTLTFSARQGADVRAEAVRQGPTGTEFTLIHDDTTEQVALPLIGDFNVENALGAAAVGLVRGRGLADIASALNRAPQVPGRLEKVVESPFRVVVDFAHTPDALERTLRTLRPLVQGRLLVVFGAGGDRDRTKRPVMGRVVAELADLAFVTSDNPRTEDPERIIDDIVAGMSVHRFRDSDRRAAISAALHEARAEDLVLLAGKGHEAYQVIGTEKLPFDEPAIVRSLISSLDRLGTGKS